MSQRGSDEPVRLLSQGENDDSKRSSQEDVEASAGRSETLRDQNLDHEYSIPSTIKFTWLGTYFFFSLLLTLYNKLVLGMVSFISISFIALVLWHYMLLDLCADD